MRAQRIANGDRLHPGDRVALRADPDHCGVVVTVVGALVKVGWDGREDGWASRANLEKLERP